MMDHATATEEANRLTWSNLAKAYLDLKAKNDRLREHLDQAAGALEGIRDLAPHHPSDRLLPVARVGAYLARAALA